MINGGIVQEGEPGHQYYTRDGRVVCGKCARRLEEAKGEREVMMGEPNRSGRPAECESCGGEIAAC